MSGPLATFEQIVTRNEEMGECLSIARTAAAADVTILLLGENGTGKNLLAQAIHAASPRAAGPYIGVNCSALSESLLESELFGHVRGAFTGAERDRRGKFEQADRGTLFLDEIGDMSPGAQAKILRAVEEHTFEPVGGERTVLADVRIIAATNHDLQKDVREGRFREDLYYRLNEVVLRVPSLRERREDIPLLVETFITQSNRRFGKQVKKASSVTLNYLLRHEWPGNVRELRSLIGFGVMVAQHDAIWMEDLTWAIQGGRLAPVAPEGDGHRPDDLSLDAVENRHVTHVLKLTGGNKKRACELLGISRPTLNRMLRRWGQLPAAEAGADESEAGESEAGADAGPAGEEEVEEGATSPPPPAGAGPAAG